MLGEDQDVTIADDYSVAGFWDRAILNEVTMFVIDMDPVGGKCIDQGIMPLDILDVDILDLEFNLIGEIQEYQFMSLTVAQDNFIAWGQSK